MFAMVPFDGQCQLLYRAFFAISLIISEIFEIFDLQTVGQGHGVQLSMAPFDGEYKKNL